MRRKYDWARISSWIIIILILFTNSNLGYWRKKNQVIAWDVISYYSYLPATFIYHDLSLSFIDKDPAKFSYKFWPNQSPTGKKVIMTSMGLSILYAPFFMAAHCSANILGYEPDGFSIPYAFALVMSCIAYLSIGLFFLRKVLERYFSKLATSITLLSVTLGTNLFHYATVEAAMSHVYNFSLFSIFIYLVIKWYDKPTYTSSVFIGLLSGFITLIRPTNIIILLPFLLWNIGTWSNFRERVIFFLRSYKLVLLMITCFVFIWTPQFLYWKYISGQFIYYSYGDRGNFFFGNPQIYNGLFGYRKGWLLYTPIMVFALIGIPILLKKQKEIFLPVFLFTILNIYIILSWWCWWYGGGYGLRAFIDSYAVLAIPFAAFLTWCFDQNKLIKISSILIVTILIAHSLFQTNQYRNNAIHWDSMSKRAYWRDFGKLHPQPDINELLEQPDYEKAMIGIQAIKEK